MDKKILKQLQPIKKEYAIRGGDTIWMEYRDYVDSKRYKTFTGVCLKNSHEVMVLRSLVGGVGIEFGFHPASKTIKDIKVVRNLPRRGGRVKRYDLRLVR